MSGWGGSRLLHALPPGLQQHAGQQLGGRRRRRAWGGAGSEGAGHGLRCFLLCICPACCSTCPAALSRCGMLPAAAYQSTMWTLTPQRAPSSQQAGPLYLTSGPKIATQARCDTRRPLPCSRAGLLGGVGRPVSLCGTWGMTGAGAGRGCCRLMGGSPAAAERPRFNFQASSYPTRSLCPCPCPPARPCARPLPVPDECQSRGRLARLTIIGAAA